MNAERPIRDVLAEMMRRERLGLIRPLWADLQKFADDECEQVRVRGDHLIRLLATEGVTLVRNGEVAARVTAPTSSVFYRYAMDDSQAVRILRATESGIEVVRVVDGVEAVQMLVTTASATVLAGRVLAGDRGAAKEPGAMTTLAAALVARQSDIPDVPP